MDITEIQDELLRLEYPNLLPDHDPDIERYYYLRTMGYSREALGIYQNRLVIRYPDSDFRTWLLRSYRSHDPVFRNLLAKGYRMLGERSLERIKRVILFIAEKADSFNERDVYSTITTAEEILKFLSPERYEAMAGMERYLRYANAMSIKVNSIARATELIRAYVTDTLSIVEEERRRRSVAMRRAEEETRRRLVKADLEGYYYQKKYGGRMPLVDLSTVDFSPADLARIEIPPYKRIEDQILGYCVKYWNISEDPAFERVLFLYSRKFGKKNYDIYMTIRRGQEARRRDDEILASLMSLLITGYYYSIQGDLYLWRNWNAIKFALANQQKALPVPDGMALPARKTPAPKSVESITLKPMPKIEQKKTGSAAGKEPKTKDMGVKPRIVPKPLSETAPRIAPGSHVNNQPVITVAKPAEKTITAIQPLIKTPEELKPARQTKPAAPLKQPDVPSKEFTNKALEKAKGSVSDRLKELSGRSYDVYEDRFLAKARASIRKVLGTGKGLFFNLPEEAEDLVYNFLRDHYSDPYMDWENSNDRKSLLAMGFDLPSIHKVIDGCYRTL